METGNATEATTEIAGIDLSGIAPPTTEVVKTAEQIAAEEAAAKASTNTKTAEELAQEKLEADKLLAEQKAKEEAEAKAKGAGNDNPPTPVKVKAENLAIDKDGNLIDTSTNAIIETKDKVKYTEDGNVVLPENVQLEGEEPANTSKNDIAQLIATIGVEVKDENGAIKTYADTVEGKAEYFQDALEHYRKNFPKEFFKANPIFEALAHHLAAGRNPTDFGRTYTYSAVQYNAKDENMNLALIRANFERKGVAAEEAEEIIKMYKTTGVWDTKGKAAYDELTTAEAAQVKANQEAAEARDAQEAKEAETYWNDVKSLVVEKGAINGATIPVNERKAFFDYISKPVDKQGNSQATLDMMKESVETSIQYHYFRFKKLNLATLADIRAKELRTIAIRKAVAGEDTGSSRNIKVQKVGGETAIPTLDDFFKQ